MFIERYGLVKKQSVGGEPNKGKTQADVSFGNGGSAASYTDFCWSGRKVESFQIPPPCGWDASPSQDYPQGFDRFL